MSADDISRDEARAALATVRDQRAAVRGADLDRLGLLLLAAVNIGSGALVGVVAGRFAVASLVTFVPMIPMVVFGFWRERNERVFSRRGRPILWASWGVYVTWFTALFFWITPRIGWHPSTPDWRMAVVSAVASIPLLIGAWLIGRVR